MNFQEIKIEDYNKLKSFLFNDTELSCENSFVNLLLWHGSEKNKFAIFSNTLIVKTQDNENIVYRIPMGENIKESMWEIYKQNGNSFPTFYGYEGQNFDRFQKEFFDYFDIVECREDFEYIYKSEDLINLSGKKYHSKRNHISAFSKKYKWEYQPITKNNLNYIIECAQKWYKNQLNNDNTSLSIDQKESKTLLENMEKLSLKGGAIFIDNKAVAYTIGAPQNHIVFDVMIEKALPEYATAYSVINNEFAKRELSDFKFINREDDMGIEGLRRAKMNYKPHIILKKYYCYYKGNINEKRN